VTLADNMVAQRAHLCRVKFAGIFTMTARAAIRANQINFVHAHMKCIRLKSPAMSSINEKIISFKPGAEGHIRDSKYSCWSVKATASR